MYEGFAGNLRLSSWFKNLKSYCDDLDGDSGITLDMIIDDYEIQLMPCGIFRFHDTELFVRFMLTYG